MGTEIKVTLFHPDANAARHAISSVMVEMERINQLLSPYLATSELTRINDQAFSAPQKVSDEFFTMLKHAVWMGDKSAGAFDVTFASLGFEYDYRNKIQPDEETIQALLPAINYKLIELDTAKQSVRFLHKNVKIDLGGIAKGYAVDSSIRLIKALGIEHASVSAGGDSYLLGDHDGRPWVIGIKHPRLHNATAKAVIRLPLSNTAVSTSGDYERYFIDRTSGDRIHHIVNPKTGRSVGDVMSVTIIAPSGAQADPLSTTVFVLGVKKGLELVDSLQGIDAIIIDKTGKVSYSEGLVPPDEIKE